MAGEALCYTYHHLFNLNVHALRLFTVYGPRQRPEMAIHLFARTMLKGDPIKLFGNGQSSRDYTYIDDIVDGVVSSINTCNGFEVINLGGSRSTSLNTLVGLISKRLRIEPTVERHPDQPGDVPRTFADITLANRLLGYRPKTDIASGIERFCTWLEEEQKKIEKEDGSILPPATVR